MPPSRKYGRKKSYRSRYPSKGKVIRATRYRGIGSMPVGQAAKYAWQGVKYLTGLVNSEMYKWDVIENVASINNTLSYVAHLSAIPQGDGDAARTGNSLLAKSLNLKGLLQWNSSAAYTSCAVRVAIVMDTQQIGDTSPNNANVFESNAPWSHLNSETVGRFKLLKSMFINLTNDKKAFNLNINIPMQTHIRYNGTAGTDIQRNGIYIMASSNVASTDSPPVLSYEARLSYHDN